VVERTPLTLAPAKLLEELTSMLGDADPREVVVAFDGDGTLWSGDVGEDLMRAALRDSFLLDAALPSLLAEAERHAIAVGAATEANEIARLLIAAYLAGQYPERDTCAMMTWCYAGRSRLEVEAFAAATLVQEDLASRLHAELSPILDWCDSKGVRRVLISASPRVVVQQAGAFRGFAPGDITAATPAVDASGRLLPYLDGAVPYAEGKLNAGRELFGDARWLAAFGDNVFDIEMLTTAEVGVAVRPKPKLEEQLPALGLRQLQRVAIP